MQSLLVQNKQQSLTDPYTKEVARKNFRTMPYHQKAAELHAALVNSITLQSLHNPGHFHPDTRTAEYAVKFADHFLDKVLLQQVLVLNETVTNAFKTLGFESITLQEVYEFMDTAFPEEQPKVPKEEKKFRGC